MATAIQTQAWNKITAYIPAGSGTAPTASLYAAAGIAGVTSANLAWVNASIIGTTLANNYTTDTTAVAGIVTSVKKLQGLANGALADVAANNLTATDFNNLKITGTSSFSATQLSLVNSLLGGKTATQLPNAAAVQAVVNSLSHVFSATTATPDAALVVADFAAVGIKGVSANNFDTVKAAMSANGTGKTTITEFQDIVSKANTALSVVMGYANGNNATDTAQTAGSASYATPTVAHYQAIGVTLTAAEATLLNSALATKGVIGTEVDTKAKLETILASVKTLAAEVGDVVVATGEPGTNHADPTVTDYQNVGLEDISTDVHARILNSFLDNQRIGDKVKIYSTGALVQGQVVTSGADAVEVLNTLTDVRVLLEEATAIKKFLAYAAGANNGLNFSDFHQLGMSTKDKDLVCSLANIRAKYAIDNAADSTKPFVNMDTVAEIQFLLQGVPSHIDRVTSSIAIANIGDDSSVSANNGAITFTVHFSKQLANAATALDADGANFELVLSDGTKLTAGKDFLADVTLDATDTTNQTYTLAVSLNKPVDDAAVTLRYLAQPTGAAAAIRDVENVVTADHTAFADESVNTNEFKQSIDTSTPDANVTLTLTDTGTDFILSGAAQGVGLVSAAEKADTSATFIVSHAADTTQVEFLSSDGTTVLATANVANSWGITLNLSTLNVTLDPNTGTGDYQFVTRETDDAGNVVHSTYTLKFDTSAQSAFVVSPITATVADADYKGTPGSEVFTVSGTAQEEGTVTVVWDQGANGTAEITLTDTVDSTDVGSSTAWSVDFLKSNLLSKGGAGQFTVTFTDLAGNSTTAQYFPTTVDTGLVYNIAAGFGPALSSNDMEVSLYKVDGTKLGKATYDTNTNKWSYTDITRYSGVVLAVLSDTSTTVADYRDEATNTDKDLASPMVSVFNVDGTSSTAISANVTALTDLAAKKMGAAGVSMNGATPNNNSAISQLDVTQADAAVAKLFGIDITGTTLAAKAPSFTVDANGVDTSSSSDAYGLALAAISKAEQNASKTTADIVSDLAAALTISAAGVPTVSLSAAIKTTMTTAINDVMTAANATAAVENSLQTGFVGSYDTTAPSLTITSDKPALKTNGTAKLTFTFSEAVKDFDASDIKVTFGTISNFAVNGSNPKVYTATFTAGAVEGDASVTVAAGAYTDLGGNSGGAGTLPNLALAVDNTAPTLSATTVPSYTLSTVAGSAGNSVGETIVLTVTFDSAVNGLTTGADSTIFTVAGTGVSAAWGGTDGTNTRTLTYTIAAGTNGQAAINEVALKTALTNGITDLAGNVFSYTGNGGIIANIDTPALPVIDTTAPTITSGATQTVTDMAGAGIAAGATVYNTISSYGTVVPSYTLSGADAGLFDISSSGAVSFKAAETHAATKDAGADHVYDFTVTATDAEGNAASKAVALTMVNGVAYSSASLYTEYAAAGYGDAISNAADVTFNANQNQALTTVANTSKDGLLNGSNALTQYIDRVTGTDIVSDAEFDAGFTITGKAAANAAGTIKFYLDNDRTDGVDQIGTQLVSGTNGVTINYTATTGDYTISFAAGSAALKQATHGTAGSGVHKLTVDTNGNGLLDGAGTVNAEGSRLFLVASGTAGTTSYDKNGTIVSNTAVAGNFSVQDTVSKNVFVYFNGDVDTTGIGMMTQQDVGDSASNQGSVLTDRDADPSGWGDGDLYNTTGVAVGTQATVTNTALGFVTNLSAKTYEFAAAQIGNTPSDWSTAQTTAGNHATTNSNTSRMMSAEELLALYAANFGGDTRATPNLPGAVQPNTNTIQYDPYVISEDNMPGGWNSGFWSSSSSPSGHIYQHLMQGYSVEAKDSHTISVAAVL
jgi:Bacterial Ig-like domain